VACAAGRDHKVEALDNGVAECDEQWFAIGHHHRCINFEAECGQTLDENRTGPVLPHTGRCSRGRRDHSSASHKH
jgi:hypothetical protein